jgi:uncharacterized RDD family membrane protein YckC
VVLPQPPIASATTEGQPAAALAAVPSITRRIACLPYEGLLLLALVLIASFPIAGLKGLTLSGVPHVVFQGYLALVIGVYFTWQWQKNGQTLPMKTWRFRVMQADGVALKWPRAVLRLICAALFFGPAAVGVLLIFFPDRLSPVITMWFFLPMVATLLYARFDPQQQFLHDRLAGTRLEEAPKPATTTNAKT